MAEQKIELLACMDCGRLVISVDDIRIPTYSANLKAHGDSKCGGAWKILVTSESEANRGK